MAPRRKKLVIGTYTGSGGGVHLKNKMASDTELTHL